MTPQSKSDAQPSAIPALLHSQSLPMPVTNKGKNGRPRGEPEAFSDYNIIYQIMSTKKPKTEVKQREQSKE